MENNIYNLLNDLTNEGMRLKKFRKLIFDLIPKNEFNEENHKIEFSNIFDKICEEGEAIVEGGFVKKLNIKNKKRNREETNEYENNGKIRKYEQKQQGEVELEEGKQEEEVDPYENSILCSLNELNDDGIRLKKFRQNILDQFATTGELSELKDNFAKAFDSICEKGYAKLDNGVVFRLGDKINVKKTKINLPPVDQEVAKKEMWKYGEQAWQDGTLDHDYLTSNPDGITRLFCGNLKKTITEEQLHNAINGITHIKWMTDKNTREFYGSTFLEMKDPAAAAAAVMLDKTKLLGRPLKIYYCPPRPGDIWPPENNPRKQSSSSSSSNDKQSNGPPRALHEIRPKPPGCRKLFCGNLDYSIDDDILCNFFKSCGELSGLRWLTRQGTGEFRGCAFVEFQTSEQADKAIKLNGHLLLDRPIRLDWD